MADTFANSLDDDLFAPIEPVSPETGTPISPLMQEFKQEQDVATAAAARWARKFDPQSYARAAELAPGVSPEIGIRQLQLLEDEDKLEKYREVLSKAPALQSYFVDRPKDLAFAKPDELDNISGLSWALQAIPAATEQGWEQTKGAYAGFAVLSGRATPDQEKAFAEFEASEWREFGKRDGWLAGGAVTAGQVFPAMGMSILGAISKGVQYGVAGGAGGFLVGGPAGAATGAGLGFRVGAPLGFFEQNYQQMAGQAYAEFRKFKDENGQPLDDNTARWAALLSGVGGAGLEQIGAMSTLGKIPGLEQLTGSFSTKGLKALLANPSYRGAFTRFAANLGEAVTVETLTEMGQQAFQSFSGEIAKLSADGQFPAKTAGELATEQWDTAVQTLQFMTLFGPFVSGTRFGADVRQVTKSIRENKQFNDLLTSLSENQLADRAPQVAADLVDAQLGGKEIYIDAQQAQQLFQEQGLDLYGPAIPNWRDRVDSALQVNGDIKMTVGEFTAFLSRNPKENPLLSLVRTDPEGYSVEETQAAIEAQEILMSGELARAQNVSTDAPAGRAQAQPIEIFPELEEIKKQITAIGFAPQAVEHYMIVMSSIYNTLATRTGRTPSELFQEHGVQIMRDALTNGSGISTDPDTFFQEGQTGSSIEEDLQLGEWEPDPGFLSAPNVSKAQEVGEGLTLAIPEASQQEISFVTTAVQQIVDGGDLGQISDQLLETLSMYENGQAIVNWVEQNVDLAPEAYQSAPASTALPEGWKEIVEEELSELATPSHWKRAGYGDNVQGDKPWLNFMTGPQKLGPHLQEVIQTPAFQQWFEGSQITDAEGTPLIVYHGTHKENIEQFKNSHRGATFFATNPSFASGYASTEAGQMYPVFLNVQKAAGQNLETLEALVSHFAGTSVNIQDVLAYWKKSSGAVRGEHFQQLFGFTRYDNDVTAGVYRLIDEFADGDLKEQAYFDSWGLVEPINELLEEIGFDGYYELEGGSINIGIFNPTRQVKSIFNRGTFNSRIDDMLAQDKKGSIQFKQGKAIIRLFDGHDMSTLLHETGHLYLQTLRDLAPTAPELNSDWLIVKKYLKIGDDNKITRDQHEKFARMAEAYFMEGKAPTPELQPAFSAFGRWLKSLYRRISQLGGKVSPEIRGVFDRMLATENRLAELEADNAYKPLFDTAEAMDLTPEEYLSYQKLVEDLKLQAQEGVTERIGNQARRLAKGWRGEIQKQLEQEALTKLKDQPPYSHFKTMKDRNIRLGTADLLAAKWSGPMVKDLTKLGLVSQKGMDPQLVAEVLGYPTTSEMLYDFNQAPPIKEAAKSLAAKEMAARYESDFDQSQIMDLAIKQQMNQDGRVTILATEFKALSKRAGRDVGTVGPTQLAQQIAKDSIYRKLVKNVSERDVNSAVRRAGTQSEQAMLKGDWALAADWKRKQILAQAIANETAVVSATVQKIRDKAARYSRTAPKGIDPSYMEQIRALTEQYEFTKVSNKKLERRASLREFLDEADREGLVVNEIPDRLLRDLERVNFKELSVEDLLGLGDTLDNLEHLGRMKNKLRTAQGMREWQALKGEGLTQLRGIKTRATRLRKNAETTGTASNLATAFLYGTLKAERIVEWLDLGDMEGFFTQNIFEMIAKAEVQRNDLNAQYNERLIKILDGVPSGKMMEIFHVASLGEKLTKEQIYAVALNTGNASNKKKLLEGELWTETQLADVLSFLDKGDWERIQKIWNVLDGLWGQISNMEKRLTGVAPPKIEALAFSNQHGTFQGGYYPVVYDFKTRRGMNLLEDTTPIDRQVSIDDIFQKSGQMTPGTSHKHTVKRTKTAKPIARELSILPSHIHKVVHDLTHREAIRSAYKILWDSDIRNEIIRIEGEHTYDQLQHWLRSVATEYAGQTDPFQHTLSHLRTGTTMVAMGYKLTTAAAQTLGILNIPKRVSPRYIAGAAAQFAKSPVKTWQMVNDLSGEMRHRFNQQDRDLRDTVKQLGQKKGPLQIVRAYAYYHIAFMDKMVSTLAWTGAYSEYLDTHPSDAEKAKQWADRTVRLTQGTGSMKDMAKVSNNNEYFKLFTMFYSAFSAIHNEIWDLTRKTKDDITAGNYYDLLTKRMATWFSIVLAPAILGPLVTGQGPDDDESYAWWATKQVMVYPTVGIPIVRDLLGALESGFDYTLSPIGKGLAAAPEAWEKLWDGEFSQAMKPLVKALATVYKLPGAQAWNTGEAVVKGLEYQDFEALDLYKGRQGR